MGLDTILGRKLLTSIDFNGLMVPANSILGAIKTHCEPALFHTGDEADLYSISKSGTLFKVKFKGRYFAISSRHQVLDQGYDHENLVLHNYFRKRLLTSHRAVFPEGSEFQKEDFDALLHEFTEVVRSGELPSLGWYDLTREINRDSIGEIKLAFAVGYPGAFNFIDYEKPAYQAVAKGIVGTPTKSGISGRLAFDPVEPVDFDPSGMSGGPVFGLELDRDGYRASFAGILTNASQIRFNFLSINRLKRMFLSLLA